MVPGERWQRFSIDLLLLGALGLLMGGDRPYRRAMRRTACGGPIGCLQCSAPGLRASSPIGPRAADARLWARVAAVSLAITPPVTLYIYALNACCSTCRDVPWLLPQLAWQVLVVMLLIMTLRALLWRRVVENAGPSSCRRSLRPSAASGSGSRRKGGAPD
jgi:hypothetical protein